jgi:Protein kinase domain
VGAVVALEPSEPTRAARRLLRLAVAARAAIDHPNLIRAWPVGDGEGRLFVAFERCAHPTLTELLADPSLGPTECARILDGAAAGVDALSQRALVARDLTPGRVLVDPEHGGVLMDLGIPLDLLRRLSIQQDPELAFRSPEELEGKPIDLRSTVYSLGAILLAALTALPPDTRMAEVRPSRSGRRATLAPEIEAVVARAMSRDPVERYENAKAFSTAAAAALGTDLAPRIFPGDHKPTQPHHQPSTKRVPRSPQRNGRPSMTGLPRGEPPPFDGERPRRHRSREVSRSPRGGETRHWSRVAQGVAARVPGAVRRCKAMVSALLALAGSAVPRAHEALRWCARAVGPIASGVASVAAGAGRRGVSLVRALCRGVRSLVLVAVRRAAELVAVLLLLAENAGRRGYSGLRRPAKAAAPTARSGASVAASAVRRAAKVAWPLFLRACRLVLAAARRGIVVAAGAGRRAHRALLPMQHPAPAVLKGTGARIDRFARHSWKWGSWLVGSGTAAVKRAPRPKRGREKAHLPAATGSVAQRSTTHRRLLLPAVGAIVASALSGIALGHAFEPEGGPSSVSRSGLTLQLPRGWEPAAADSVLPTLSPAIAAAPSGERGAGFLAGNLSSLAAAEQMLGEVQIGSEGRTQVQLGRLNAWQYTGLRPRPHMVATGYLIPTTGGAVLAMCHASTDDAPVRLGECMRAVATLVVRGERPRPLSSADQSNERMTRLLATLRASRAEGRRRLKAAELGRGQARAATSLQLSHERAAWTLDRISALENGHSLENLSAAVRNAGAAYGRLAHAASISNRSAYRRAGHAVVREEELLRRELARTGDA